MDTYHSVDVPYFATSARKRTQRNRKIYPIDTGLRHVAISPGSADRGKSLECATQLVLRRRLTDADLTSDSGAVFVSGGSLSLLQRALSAAYIF